MQHLPGTNMVRNILNAWYGTNYCTPPIMPADTDSHDYRMMQARQPAKQQQVKSTIKVYPNPANNYVTFDVDSANAITKIFVFDMYGRQVQLIPLNGQQQINVNTENWPNGIYIWQVRQTGSPLQQGKLEIIK